MKCPYCNNEMEQGIIQSPQELSWKRGTKRPIMGRAEFHEGSVVLSELPFMKGSAVVLKSYNTEDVLLEIEYSEQSGMEE